MPKAHELKRGSIVAVDGVPHSVEELQISSPTARGASSIYRVRFRNLATKQKRDMSLRGDDAFADIDFERRELQYSYADGDRFVFTDLEDYSEIVLPAEDLSEERQFLIEGMEGIQGLMSEGRTLGIEMPTTVELDIVECDPSVRGASATARTKPATLSTGYVVQVPEYMASGERIKVDTRTGKSLGRA
ncbi:MAG: elongation factor P [Lentisphaerae bacterium]|nr:elongation factor P [Lentisphaerota bacterium]